LNQDINLKMSNKKNLLLIALATLGLSVVTMAQNVPSYVPTNGLVSWYPFNGNSNDESGNANHATVNGPLLTSDRFSNPNAAYSFNGINDYLQGNASSFPTGDRTIALWFYSTNINVGNLGMQVFGYGGGQCMSSWLMQMDNQTPSTSFFTDNTFEIALGCNVWITALNFGVNGTPQNPNNNWHHWVATSSQTGIDFYIDGLYVGGVTNPISNTVVAGKKFYVGSCPDSTGMIAYQDAFLKNWNGKLDDIGIWNRALTQQEVTALFNGGEAGINNIDSDLHLLVYPNPAHNYVQIQLNEEHEDLSFSIVDLCGRSVLRGKVDKNNLDIDVRDFSSGVYYFQLDGYPFNSVPIIKE